MGIIMCKIHGQTGIALVSPDIEKDFLTSQKPSGKYYQYKTEIFDRVVNLCWLSSSFIERFNIPKNEVLLSLGEFPDASGDELLSSLVPVCGRCFTDWFGKDS